MTNYVGRGANRASAMGRTNRAAQRTPLPPRGTPVPRDAVRIIGESFESWRARRDTAEARDDD